MNMKIGIALLEEYSPIDDKATDYISITQILLPKKYNFIRRPVV